MHAVDIEMIEPPQLSSDTLMIGKSQDYPAGHATVRHSHPTAQLLYGIAGVMRVLTARGQWIVPPTRAIYIPPGHWHEVHMLSPAQMRSVYVQPSALAGMPQQCCVLAVTPLWRELLLAAVRCPPPVLPGTRAARLLALLLEEMEVLETLPLALPTPDDALLAPLCNALQAQPDDARSSDDWAARLGVDVRTLQRRFVRATGMNFGAWRRQARLMHALAQLAAGARVLDVALDAGYASPSAFSAMFRRQFGVVPSEFFGASDEA
ncbi:AraC family transcriptional regulator [Vogesella oryzae]|uniref:AraC family transcriptional regulator n=1 Tax=Vogesella oryzae TaxID=1735285 RepID=UPI0015842D8B|nr:helix-turn-helix transcriptional regulator [Vogesella oryzae]